MSFREAVDRLHAQYLDAFRRRDAVGAAAGYTEDAVYLTGGEPVRGRAAIAAAVAAYWKSGVVEKGLTTLSAEAEGNLGYVLETVETSAGKGTALLVLRRDGQGRWGICAEAFFEK